MMQKLSKWRKMSQPFLVCVVVGAFSLNQPAARAATCLQPSANHSCPSGTRRVRHIKVLKLFLREINYYCQKHNTRF